jgi:hypothetical protein
MEEDYRWIDDGRGNILGTQISFPLSLPGRYIHIRQDYSTNFRIKIMHRNERIYVI